VLQVVRVGTFDRHAEGSTPDLAGGNSEGTGDTEQDGVVVMLGQTVVHQKSTGAAVDVGPGVLYLASSAQDFGNDFVVGLDEVDEVRVLDVSISEVELANESRVSLS